MIAAVAVRVRRHLWAQAVGHGSRRWMERSVQSLLSFRPWRPKPDRLLAEVRSSPVCTKEGGLRATIRFCLGSQACHKRHGRPSTAGPRSSGPGCRGVIAHVNGACVQRLAGQSKDHSAVPAAVKVRTERCSLSANGLGASLRQSFFLRSWVARCRFTLNPLAVIAQT